MKAKKTKQEEALVRQEVYDKLTLHQRLARLDFKLGVGLGAVKERVKLMKKIEQLKRNK